MTVKELIEELQDMPENMEVYATSDYGDYIHTQQLIMLGNPQILTPYKTAYSETGLAINIDDDNDKNDDEIKVVVLNG